MANRAAKHFRNRGNTPCGQCRNCRKQMVINSGDERETPHTWLVTSLCLWITWSVLHLHWHMSIIHYFSIWEWIYVNAALIFWKSSFILVDKTALMPRNILTMTYENISRVFTYNEPATGGKNTGTIWYFVMKDL